MFLKSFFVLNGKYHQAILFWLNFFDKVVYLFIYSEITASEDVQYAAIDVTEQIAQQESTEEAEYEPHDETSNDSAEPTQKNESVDIQPAEPVLNISLPPSKINSVEQLINIEPMEMDMEEDQEFLRSIFEVSPTNTALTQRKFRRPSTDCTIMPQIKEEKGEDDYENDKENEK